MTIDELKNYRSICAEIADIKKELAGHYAGDTVQSGSKHPYSVHNVRIEGYKSDAETISLLTRLSVLERSRDQIQEYINSIDDFQTKKMFILRFVHGYSWLQVAHKIRGNTADSCRMRVIRYLHKS